MSALRWIKKTLLLLGLILLLFSGAVAVLSYIYGDLLIDRFLVEANKKLTTPVQTGAIEVSWWEKFPHISIALRDVIIDGSLPGDTDTLGIAKNVYCTFNAWDILLGQWEVDQVHMESGRLFLVYTELGDNNYTIVNKDTSKSRQRVGFSLDKIFLDDMALTYLDLRRDQEYKLHLDHIEASLSSRDQQYDISLEGALNSEYFRIQDRFFLENKALALVSDLTYTEKKKLWDFRDTEVGINSSSFDIAGWYQGADSAAMNMTIAGKNTNIQTLLSLLPEEIAAPYKAYKSKGEVYFKSRLNGLVGANHTPSIDIDFGCNHASFYHPDYKKGIEQVTLKGNYQSSKASSLTAAVLSLSEIQGTMESHNFRGDLVVKNLKDYHIRGDFKGVLDLNSWQRFLPPGKITKASGIMNLDVAFEGPVRYLKSNKAVDNFKTSGEVSVSNLDFDLSKNSLPFRDFSGNFLFNGRDLAISDFSGSIGNSDFVINGLFKNIIAFLFSQNQAIGIEADLQAVNIDLDELLTGNAKAPDVTVVGNQAYTSFEISPRLELSFDCSIERLKFRRFRGRKISGQLLIAHQIARGKNLSVSTLGGRITMNGEVNGKKKDHLTIRTRSSYDGIHLDSLFYVFENFSQDFLQDHHLKGEAFAEIDSYMAFDNHLRFKSKDLVVDAGLIVENGELNNFEPMQKLSSYVERRSLANMTFGDLKNDIHIEDRMIHLPNMVVQSNVTTIMVNGTHSLDQNIDYRLKVPLKGHKKDKDAYYGALEDDGLNTNLYLKIIGNTKDYRIVYDKQAVKTKIKEDLREEKWEIRDAIRNKGVDNATQELNEEEFFEFDESDSTAVQ